MKGKDYKVGGYFLVLFTLDEEKYRNTYEELNALEDIIKIALEKDYIRVKWVRVNLVQKVEKKK